MSYSPEVAKVLVEKYGFVTQPDGAVVSPSGFTRNEAGQTVKYTAPAADPAPAAPVVAADPGTAALDPVASASMADVKQNSIDQLMALANQTAASNQQLSDQLGFGSGAEALPPEPEGTGVMFQGDELTQDQVDRVTKQFNSNQINKYGLETLMESNQGRMNRIINPIKKDKDAFYGKGADSTGKITSGKDRGKDSQALIDHEKRLSEKSGDGFMADLALAKDDLVTKGGQLGGDLKDLASSVGGGLTSLVDQGKQFLGITAPGAVLSSSAPLGRPAGLDNFGYDEDGEVFDSATYDDKVFYDMFGGRHNTRQQRDLADEIYRGQSASPDDTSFSEGQDFTNIDPVTFEEKQDELGEFGVDGSFGSAYDELGPSPGDLAAIGGDVVTLGDGMGEGQDQISIGVDGTYNPIGGEDDTSLNEGQENIFTNVDPVTFDPITGGDDSGGDDAADGGDTGGGASGGGDQGGGSGGGGGDPDPVDPVDPDPVDPDPVDPDPVDPDDPVGSDPLVPFIPSNSFF